MFESPLIYALVIFSLGFIAGIIVSTLFQAARNSTAGLEDDYEFEGLPTPSPTPLVSDSLQDNKRGEALAQDEGNAIETAPSPPQSPVSWVSSLSNQPVVQPEQVRASPVESFLHSVRSSTVKEPSKPLTMAAEIDTILQEKLPDSELAGRIVRIEEQPDFGLLVVVDGEKYAGVNAVPDEAVRALIQSAVAEWQERRSS